MSLLLDSDYEVLILFPGATSYYLLDMRASSRLQAKKQQKKKHVAQKKKVTKEQNKKKQLEAPQAIQKKRKTTTKQLRKALLSLSTTKTQTGKQIVIHDKYQIDDKHPLYTQIDDLVQLLQDKEKKKDQKILNIIQYSNFPNFEFVLRNQKPEEEKCCICQYQFEAAADHKKQLTSEDDYDIVHLNCTHLMHTICFKQLLGDKNWIKCPLCYTIFGEMTGDQPRGTMNSKVDKNLQCDGYPPGTIVINYSFPSGKRADNGESYSGTHRTAYLPNTPQGQQVLQLLNTAFKRKLTFTIGRSVTTGMDNQVVWNGIHHKTHTHGGSSHFGYPDPTYFSRVKIELAMKGVC